jgi:predicted MFS family arabinose efflux permease
VLSGLAGVALSSLIFGVAQNYWVALAARVVGGLLNGNVAVMQTMVAEMVKNPKHERTFEPFPKQTKLISPSSRI